MKIIFLGSKDRGVRCLQALMEAKYDVKAVITAKDNDLHKFWEGSVEKEAKKYRITVFTPAQINNPQFVAQLKGLKPDLMIMSGYNDVLGKEILQIPPKGVINLHAGKLPFYRGGSPLNWAIINGEKQGWATIHYCTQAIDQGPILLERKFLIDPLETIREVQERTVELFAKMLLEVLVIIKKGNVKTKKVDFSKGVYYASRKPADGVINWQKMNAQEVYNFVRALTHPYPGAFCFYQGKKIYIWKTMLINEVIKHSPGRICMKKSGGRIVIAKDKGLVVEMVQIEGETEKNAADILEKGEYLR